MEKELEGRVALVTGASRGIGAGIALALGKCGASVALNYRENRDKAAGVLDEIRGSGGESEIFQADMSNPDDIDQLVTRVEETLGPVDILVNNAGIHQHLPIEELSYESWLNVVQVNLNAVFLTCKKAIPSMKKLGWGRIINISSINAFAGTSVECHYGATKAAIVGLTKALALETAPHGITVNAIAPGAIDTDMLAADSPERKKKLIAAIPVGRIGIPEDIAHTAIFLASPAAAFITGQVIHVNGGEGLY